MCWQLLTAGLVLQDVQTHKSNRHACMQTTCLLLIVAQDSHFQEWHQVTCGEPAECGSSWRSAAICSGGKNRRSVYLGLLEWRCPLSKRCFSCQRLNKRELICISLVPPLLLAPLEEFNFSFPPARLWTLSLFHAMLLSGSKFIKGRHFFFSKSRITLAVQAEWLMNMCFHSFQVWSAWLKRHDLDPWWAYGLKTLSDCLAISPHFNWKPNVHPQHIN